MEQLVSLVMRYHRAATSTVAESATGPPQGAHGVGADEKITRSRGHGDFGKSRKGLILCVRQHPIESLILDASRHGSSAKKQDARASDPDNQVLVLPSILLL